MQELRGEFHTKAVTASDICHHEGPGSILLLLWKSYQCVNVVQLLLHWIVPIFSLKERKHKEEATFWAGQLRLSESKIFPVVAECACDPMETVLHRRTHNRQPDTVTMGRGSTDVSSILQRVSQSCWKITVPPEGCQSCRQMLWSRSPLWISTLCSCMTEK